MNRKISITTDNPALYSLLKADLPDAVQIISDSPLEKYSLEPPLTTDIQIVVDLAVIGKNNFVAWLINRARVLKGKHKININRQHIPVNNPEAVELLIKEIEDKE